jgi:hypothetical protein
MGRLITILSLAGLNTRAFSVRKISQSGVEMLLLSAPLSLLSAIL